MKTTAAPTGAANDAQVQSQDLALSEIEFAALEFLHTHGGSVLVTAIPDKNDKGMFGEKIAGMRVYQKLDKRGLLVLTEEPVEEDGFQYTSAAEMTDAGHAAFAAATALASARRAALR